MRALQQAVGVRPAVRAAACAAALRAARVWLAAAGAHRRRRRAFLLRVHCAQAQALRVLRWPAAADMQCLGRGEGSQPGWRAVCARARLCTLAHA